MSSSYGHAYREDNTRGDVIDAFYTSCLRSGSCAQSATHCLPPQCCFSTTTAEMSLLIPNSCRTPLSSSCEKVSRIPTAVTINHLPLVPTRHTLAARPYRHRAPSSTTCYSALPDANMFVLFPNCVRCHDCYRAFAECHLSWHPERSRARTLRMHLSGIWIWCEARDRWCHYTPILARTLCIFVARGSSGQLELGDTRGNITNAVSDASEHARDRHRVAGNRGAVARDEHSNRSGGTGGCGIGFHFMPNRGDMPNDRLETPR